MSSQLTEMRKRIQTIETIKKITHAMRLISMSLHARLKNQEEFLSLYKNTLNTIFYTVRAGNPEWQHPLVTPPTTSTKTLLIVLGSNKGLCGNFNSALFKMIEAEQPKLHNVHYITLGSRAQHFCATKKLGVPVHHFGHFSAKTLPTIAQAITHEILNTPYAQVIVFSNMLKNFFIQKPRMTQIIPLTQHETTDSSAHDEYIWEQNPQEVLDILIAQVLQAQIHYILFESLIAEQAARFLSMDTATRNAKKILEESRLLYNKLRQTKITKELTELCSNF